MNRQIKLIYTLCLIPTMAFSQNEGITAPSNIFSRITQSIKEFKLDTTAAPNDKITKKIIELRNLRGGFNISEAIDYKIEEDRQKNEIPKSEIESLATFFKSGNGKKWLDNAIIWIYRQQFSYNELKLLVKFYKTPTGQKMAANFPIIMMKSLRVAEIIKENYLEKVKQ